MPTTVVKQRVADFAAWKSKFDASEAARAASGATVWSCSRDLAEPNTVVVVSDFATLESMRKFMDALKHTFAESGVVATELRVFDSEIKL